MKRVTIAMDDDLYKDLLDYAADQSKLNVRRLSIGEAVRSLISVQLNNIGYSRRSGAARVNAEDSLERRAFLARS